MKRPRSGFFALAFALALVACNSTAPTPSAPVTPIPTPGAATPSPSPDPDATPAATAPATPRPTVEPRPTPDEGTYQPLVLDSFGYTAVTEDGNDFATWGAVLTNPNTEWSVFRMPVAVSFLGPDSALLNSADLQVTVLPGQTTAIGGQTFGASAATEMVVELADDPTPYRPLISSGTIEITDLESEPSEAGLLTTGTLTSSLTTDQTFLQLFAIYSDAEGNIVGGTAGAVEAMASGASVPFEISEAQPPADMAATDVYWQLGGQLPE